MQQECVTIGFQLSRGICHQTGCLLDHILAKFMVVFEFRPDRVDVCARFDPIGLDDRSRTGGCANQDIGINRRTLCGLHFPDVTVESAPHLVCKVASSFRVATEDPHRLEGSHS